MSLLKVWMRMLRMKGKMLLRHLLYKRKVRKLLYFTYNVPFPGGKGVSIYHVLSYFLVSSLGGGSIPQRAKGLAYSFLAALPPLLIFFFSLVAYFPVDGVQDELLAGMGGIVPGKILDPLTNTVNDIMGHRHSTLLSIGFITSILLAANGMNGFILSLNFANNSIEQRPFIQRFLICLALVFIMYLLIVLVVCLLIGHKQLLHLFVSWGWFADSAFGTLLFNVGRWVLLSLATLLAVSLIYYWAPAKKQRVSFFSPGAMLATGMFFLLTWGFGVYINNFSRYNLLYGSIGTLLLLMLWIYFSCIVLLVGYELNISIYNGTLRGKRRVARRELKDRIQIFKDDNTEKPRKGGA
jgi:membrane protein